MTAMLSRLFLLACLLASPAALGQTYPDRNVTIVVTSAAGALTDTLTRAVAQRLSEMWKQNVIVENRGGAGYSIAAQSVMRAEHDGYTLLASETGFYTTQPHLYAEGKLAYDAEKDFVPVAGYGTIPTVPRGKGCSITSSARESSWGDASRLSALAVLRLITSSNFVGAHQSARMTDKQMTVCLSVLQLLDYPVYPPHTPDELHFGGATGVLSQTTFGVEKAPSGKATCDGASSSAVWRRCCHSARVRNNPSACGASVYS
jgi:hypothetical protein